MLKFIKSLLIFSWMLMIFVSSSISVPPEDLGYHKKLIDYTYDKSMHLLLFGILAYFIVSFLAEYKKIKWRNIFWIAILFCYFFGITDEWHQGFIPGRGVSYWDLVFNLIGAIFGFIVYRLWHVVRKRGWHAKNVHSKGIL